MQFKVLSAGRGQEQGLRTLPLLPAAQTGPVWVKMGNLFARREAERSRLIRQLAMAALDPESVILNRHPKCPVRTEAAD